MKILYEVVESKGYESIEEYILDLISKDLENINRKKDLNAIKIKLIEMESGSIFTVNDLINESLDIYELENLMLFYLNSTNTIDEFIHLYFDEKLLLNVFLKK